MLLSANSSNVGIAPGLVIEVDAEAFSDELAECEREMRSRRIRGVLVERLGALVTNYPGDFLAGHYDDWIEPQRSRIRERYHNGLSQLITLHKGRSQYEEALQFASILVEQEPLQEELHREVMRLHALVGQPSKAERQFERCRAELRAELGVEPSAKTVELAERIRADAPSLGVRVRDAESGNAQIVGRVREMGVLMGRVDELVAGDGGVVLVEGDPGSASRA
ncbi:MAG: hypothetical protein F6J94_21220 [Moorea sp. SIO1F2]|uniref:bacterial transcriptional activator domain-containing protein n=1 Tax=Moorena sp. SIO1F2 TaxID=2607819 RepID=UPI0013B6C319|nr:bacterial transcriptional activator domain-containing protein [Moorena sp. SIO1F2]NET84343.1 hypothetical protein [Moorena sp. SIO1F2]